jgi:hypothetical protein
MSLSSPSDEQESAEGLPEEYSEEQTNEEIAAMPLEAVEIPPISQVDEEED